MIRYWFTSLSSARNFIHINWLRQFVRIAFKFRELYSSVSYSVADMRRSQNIDDKLPNSILMADELQMIIEHFMHLIS